MQTEITDWVSEIGKIAERSIKRSQEILENIEKNMEAKDDNKNSEDSQY